MAETYVECLIKRKDNQLAKFIKILMIVMAVASILLSCMFMQTAVTLFLLVAGVILGVGAYFMNLNLNLEYEYLYLDKSLSIDKIRAQQKRKKVAEYDLNKMEIFAPIRSHELDSFHRREVKTVDYSTGISGEQDKRYVMYYDGKEKIILSPSPELIKAIKNIAPRKVFEY